MSRGVKAVSRVWAGNLRVLSHVVVVESRWVSSGNARCDSSGTFVETWTLTKHMGPFCRRAIASSIATGVDPCISTGTSLIVVRATRFWSTWLLWTHGLRAKDIFHRLHWLHLLHRLGRERWYFPVTQTWQFLLLQRNFYARSCRLELWLWLFGDSWWVIVLFMLEKACGLFQSWTLERRRHVQLWPAVIRLIYSRSV